MGTFEAISGIASCREGIRQDFEVSFWTNQSKMSLVASACSLSLFKTCAFVCVCVCVCGWMHACLRACVRECMRVGGWAGGRAGASVRACMPGCACVCMYVRVLGLSLSLLQNLFWKLFPIKGASGNYCVICFFFSFILFFKQAMSKKQSKSQRMCFLGWGSLGRPKSVFGRPSPEEPFQDPLRMPFWAYREGQVGFKISLCC